MRLRSQTCCFFLCKIQFQQYDYVKISLLYGFGALQLENELPWTTQQCDSWGQVESLLHLNFQEQKYC